MNTRVINLLNYQLVLNLVKIMASLIFQNSVISSICLLLLLRNVPFCGEPFELSQSKKRPPYGNLDIKITTRSGSARFFELDFRMKSGSVNGKSYSSRNQYAYIPLPIVSNMGNKNLVNDSLLALYMMIKAFEAGKLFTIGTSVTHGTFGITFGGIHMKTQMSGGLSNHGYGSNPMKELKDSVLPNMISECNSVNIFTPMQEDDFTKQAAKQKQATKQSSKKVSKKSLPKRVSKKTRRSVKRKVSRKRRSVKRKVSRKRRSVKRKVSRKHRNVKRKVSRKRRNVKKKTLKELREECKAKGEVYDTKMKQCRPSKRRKRRSMKRKTSHKRRSMKRENFP